MVKKYRKGVKVMSLLEKHKKSYIMYSRTQVFKNKKKRTQNLILKALNENKKPYIAVSTGKDSMSMLGLIYELGIIDIMFHDSRVELPESYNIISKINKNFNTVKIIKSPVDVLEVYKKKNAFEIGACEDIAFTEAMMQPIESWIKENNYDLAFIGLRKQESSRRRKMLCHYGSYFYSKTHKINQCFPLADWKGEDIWAYLLTHPILKNMIHPAYYKDKLVDDPAKIRISWYCDPTMSTKGHFLWLKHYYPHLFENLLKSNPEIISFV